LPPFVTPVGLFVNASAGEIAAACLAVPQLVLQFHGDETPNDCRQAARPYIRAARMQPGFDLLDFSARHADAQALLLDTHVESYGGSGKVFDWSLIPPNVPHPVVLSGGLHAGNVIEGIGQVRPWAVDVSSGVELAKGIKDAAEIRRFCDAVREGDARRAASTT
jgi:phosphoribosylanthranilate isomerase